MKENNPNKSEKKIDPKNHKMKEETTDKERLETIEIKIAIKDYVDNKIFNEMGKMEPNIKKFIHTRFLAVLGILGVGSVIGIYSLYITIYNNIKSSVSAKLNEEFKKENIQVLIKTAAQEYTEKVARSYISEQVANAITPFKKEMKETLSNANNNVDSSKRQMEKQLIQAEENMASFNTKMENTLNKANNKVDALATLKNIDIMGKVALNGGREAFEKLEILTNSKSDFQDYANLQIREIFRITNYYYNRPPNSLFSKDELARIKNGKNINFNDLSLDEMIEALDDDLTTHERRNVIMFYIIKKPKEEVLNKTLDILENSKHLWTCAAMCGVCSKLINSDIHRLDLKSWEKLIKEALKNK